MSGPSTTVVVSAYNQPHWLELVLHGLAAQTDPDFDVIVADDGSTPPASELLGRLAPKLGLELRVIWQDDDGFRKARIQNLAAACTDAALLIFIDGDCLPFRNLVADYRAHYVPGEFAAGAVSYLDRDTTERLTPEDVRVGAHEASLPWRETLRLQSVHAKNLWHVGGKLTRPRFKGGNFAVSADLFREVDGFDEQFCGYAKEDSDLRNRMRNAGAHGLSRWHRARVCHIWWNRPFGRGRESPSEALYEAGKGRVRAVRGMSSHERGESQGCTTVDASS